MSQSYEMMYILRPDLTEDQVQETINKYKDFLSEQGAEDIQIQNRGKRRLAYPIKKLQDGIYILMNYRANGKQVAPLERAMRLSDEVIRYLTLTVKDEQPAPASEDEESEAAVEPAEAQEVSSGSSE